MNDKQKLLPLCLSIVLLKSMLYIYMYTGLKRNGNLRSICLKQHNYHEADPGIVLKRKNIFESTNVKMNFGWVIMFSVNLVTQHLMQNI